MNPKINGEIIAIIRIKTVEVIFLIREYILLSEDSKAFYIILVY